MGCEDHRHADCRREVFPTSQWFFFVFGSPSRPTPCTASRLSNHVRFESGSWQAPNARATKRCCGRCCLGWASRKMSSAICTTSRVLTGDLVSKGGSLESSVRPRKKLQTRLFSGPAATFSRSTSGIALSSVGLSARLSESFPSSKDWSCGARRSRGTWRCWKSATS